MSVEETMASCIKAINDIKDSGYWPFITPAPCSTEVVIKDGLNDALRGLEKALYWHQKEFTNTGRDCMVAPSFTIKQQHYEN